MENLNTAFNSTIFIFQQMNLVKRRLHSFILISFQHIVKLVQYAISFILFFCVYIDINCEVS